jgi:hypothetical protein
MCHTPTTLKLCTCATNAQNLPHYWVLHRYHPDKGIMVIGQLWLPDYISSQAYYNRQQSILAQLTTGAAFDQPMAFKDNDVLQLVLHNHNEAERAEYCFGYLQGTWEHKETHYFDLESNYEIQKEGEVVIVNDKT